MKTVEKKKKDKKIPKKRDFAKLNELNKNLIYIIVFSLIGLLIESICGFVITDKGFVLGPLCPIYGILAITVIKALSKYKNNKIKLFFYGMLIGTLMEYLVSFILEAVFGIKFWDYTGTILNFSERINTIHIPIFGVIIVLIILSTPIIDSIIAKCSGKIKLIIDCFILVILIIDILFTVWGIIVYKVRVKETLNGKNYISNNTFIEKFENQNFSNENMSKIFPRFKMLDNNGEKRLVSDLIK